MKKGQRGFTIIELQVAIAIMTLVAIAATISVIQVLKFSPVVADRFTAIRHVQNAGNWITRDAEMAEEIKTTGLTYPDFLLFTWMIYGYDGEPSVFHKVTYSFTDVSQGVGKLKRTYWNTAGASEQNLIAEYIFYDPSDPGNTTTGIYQNPEFTIKLTGRFRGVSKSEEYKVVHRPNTFY